MLDGKLSRVFLVCICFSFTSIAHSLALNFIERFILVSSGYSCTCFDQYGRGSSPYFTFFLSCSVAGITSLSTVKWLRWKMLNGLFRFLGHVHAHHQFPTGSSPLAGFWSLPQTFPLRLKTCPALQVAWKLNRHSYSKLWFCFDDVFQQHWI